MLLKSHTNSQKYKTLFSQKLTKANSDHIFMFLSVLTVLSGMPSIYFAQILLFLIKGGIVEWTLEPEHLDVNSGSISS